MDKSLMTPSSYSGPPSMEAPQVLLQIKLKFYICQ